MSFLVPLYALGIASIALPFIFHLIRRTPRGRYAFSSLMFLTPSPPRLTRRSRIDNRFLLLLRGLALTLLALAFTRPFLREAANLSLGSIRGRRIAIVLDTSASMRRADVWNQAVSQARIELAALEPADDVALFAFDQHPRMLVDFDERPQPTQLGKATLVEDQLKTLSPSWSKTDFGAALVMVADAIDVANDRNQSDAASEIVLISDLQQGALISALQSYEWPQNIVVSVRHVSPTLSTNASLRLLKTEDDHDAEPRVRIFNAANSSADQFYVGWETGETRADIADDIAVTVPPGQSRVVRVPHPNQEDSFDRLVLRGDDHSFDNIFYTVPIENQSLTVVYVGDDADGDPTGHRYFLEAALQGIPHCDISLVIRREEEPLSLDPEQPPRMIVVAQPVTAEQMDELKSYLAAGGSCLVVPTSHDAAVQLTSFNKTIKVLDDPPERREGDYVMLSEIDFGHPVFAEFAAAEYNDFTKIHFWNHFRFTLGADESTRVFAKFDDGYPALWEQSYEEGTLYVLTSGWRLRDSQLALSKRFVPLIMGLMEQAGGGRLVTPALTVNQSIELPADSTLAEARMIRPDATSLPLATGLKRFDDTNLPGLYEVATTTVPFRFAVNLDPAESDTARMDIEQLEQYGLRLGKQAKQSEEIERERQLRDTELENRQKIWRWLIVVVLCVLTFETWLAGRKTAAGSDRTGDQA